MNRPRPFATIAERDEAFVTAWNAVVRPGDIVWHLGDFTYRCDLASAGSIEGRLNGRIRLIRGNHEKLCGQLDWDGPVVDLQRVFVQESGTPESQAI